MPSRNTPLKEPEYGASESVIKDTVASNALWNDLRLFLQDRISTHQDLLETERDHLALVFSQGIIANCRDILDLPQFLQEALKQKAEDVDDTL